MTGRIKIIRKTTKVSKECTKKALSQRNRFPSVSQRAVFQRMNMNISQEKNSPAVIQNESA